MKVYAFAQNHDAKQGAMQVLKPDIALCFVRLKYIDFSVCILHCRTLCHLLCQFDTSCVRSGCQLLAAKVKCQ